MFLRGDLFLIDVGIIAEKPSAARNFSKALGGMSGSYKGTSYVIVSCRGHMYEFLKPDKQVPRDLQARYKSWDLGYLPWDSNDFSWARGTRSDTLQVLKQMQKTLQGCSEICIATDLDPTGEGDLIGWEVIEELQLENKSISRAKFVDEAAVSLQKGFLNRVSIKDKWQDPMYLKATYRSRFDFLTMQFTRIAKAMGDGKSVLRQGRLKSGIVYLVGNQLDKVNAYKKIPFYSIRFRDENGNVYINDKEPQFKSKDEVVNSYKASDVVIDSKEAKSSPPPKLLDLASLTARLIPYGFKAASILSTYQKMYEDQIVSYPRTEDKYISNEQFKEMLPYIDQIAQLVGVDTKLLTHRTARKTHVRDGGAHGANRPGTNVPGSLDDLNAYGKEAKLIYMTLAYNFLAMFAEDYHYERQVGHIKDYPLFVGSVNIPTDLGYKLIFSDEDDVDERQNKGLGMKGSPFIYEGFPPKPKAPTFKWLKNQLEIYDIGTSATRTSTYAELTRSISSKNPYPLLKDTKGKITLTEFGLMSYHLLPDTYIGSLDFTKQVQDTMKQVSKDGRLMNSELSKVSDYVIHDLKQMEINGKKMRKELGVSQMAVEQKEKATGVFNGKEVKFNRKWGDYRFTDDEVDRLLNGETIIIKDLISKNGNEYDAIGSLQEQTYKGHKFYGFKIDEDAVPTRWSTYRFTEKERQLLAEGKIIEIKGVISKRGTTYDTEVRFGKKPDGSKGIIPSFAEGF